MIMNESCGVFGIKSKAEKPLAHVAYYGLYALQHRGQESAGIVVNHDREFYSRKDLGLVSEVFSDEDLKRLPEGNIAIGHVRYGTTGGTIRANCQPIEVHHHKGNLALAHNGNLSNAALLHKKLEEGGAIFHSTSDTEIIAYLITQHRLRERSIEDAVSKAMYDMEGAYSLVITSPTKMMAVRDPNGFRPLCYGVTPDGDHVVASETCALFAVGAEWVKDLEPGEMLVFDEDGVVSRTDHCGSRPKKTCIFEYIYFARPDSRIDGISVHRSRLLLGELLYESAPAEADVVIGVPDSGLDAALGFSHASGIPYGIGLIKNKYIGRTFIAPAQEDRVDKVKIKLSPIRSEIEGKRVILIDDSIVRGTTMGQIVKMLRDAGAKEVHVRISAPPFLHPCYYGTDIDSEENLIACHYTVEEICNIIGAESLAYLPLDKLDRITGGSDHCAACFDGIYP
ncbi:MAG: amidophosphoribosyltransferase [Lachnospiraceae bacterium]|nr:amidophosphoribosyltransferase [Lachnospiraceae bacterium]MBQ9607432.1 amidophosphoribosyltransferase [Lachnospiraceae bacterium]